MDVYAQYFLMTCKEKMKGELMVTYSIAVWSAIIVSYEDVDREQSPKYYFWNIEMNTNSHYDPRDISRIEEMDIYAQA